MEEEIKKNSTFDLAKIRQTYPKAFMKWTQEEDNSLIHAYKDYEAQERKDFDEFLNVMSRLFERKITGIRGHLAKFFPDIPGWDYKSQKQRDEVRKLARQEKKKMASVKKNTDFEEGLSEKEEPPLPVLNLDDNFEAQEALRLLTETSQNIFLTGEAGTGKSTLLQYFRRTTYKNVVALAPTGVAALNVEGQTIHSFCSFGPDITLHKVKKLNPWSPKRVLLQKLHTIIIDEISMVRADLLDCVDKFLRINGPVDHLPFGGIQIVLIGDLHQLPPVEKDFASNQGLIKEYDSPYFFDARSFKAVPFAYVRLSKMYRQKDREFIEVLNAIRNNAATEEHLTILNQRAQTENTKFTFQKFAIYLTTTNNRARQVNEFFLQKQPSEQKVYEGSAMGSFEDRELPTDKSLHVKIGAQIMMLNNDTKGRWVNGTMGKIIDIKKEGGESQKEAESGELVYETEDGEENYEHRHFTDVLVVELENGEIEQILPHTWEMYQFVYDQKNKRVDSRTTGTFTQYPLKLAWAVTIHKSQGKSFDKVYIDLSTGTFAHGQLYVALSRCRTLEGLVLRRPIEQRDILLDSRIVTFMKNFEVGEGENE